MISVGGLKKLCERIENEYGSDSSVVMQIYDESSKQLLEGRCVIGIGWNEAGTLFLSNMGNEQK